TSQRSQYFHRILPIEMMEEKRRHTHVERFLLKRQCKDVSLHHVYPTPQFRRQTPIERLTGISDRLGIGVDTRYRRRNVTCREPPDETFWNVRYPRPHVEQLQLLPG